jgi:hypothetical protein
VVNVVENRISFRDVRELRGLMGLGQKITALGHETVYQLFQ